MPMMRTYTLASRGGRDAALWMVAAVLAIGAFLFGGASVAHADPVSFFDQWVAHDSSMQLSRDGTGTLVLGAGAFDTDQWSVTWTKNRGDSITITLASLVERSGEGMGKVGDQYLATIQPDSSGNQVLYLHQINPDGDVVTFCTAAGMKSADSPCGA
jgi:hypothetical protein